MTRCFYLHSFSSWYLSSSQDEEVDYADDEDDEDESPILSFEQIERGDFNWEGFNYGSFETAFVMIPADKEWDSVPEWLDRVEFQYSVEEIFDDGSLEEIQLCCDMDLSDDVTLRNKRNFFIPEKVVKQE
jgi:hypothetical protein